MTVTAKRSNLIPFEELELGVVFNYKGIYCMKIEVPNNLYNAACLIYGDVFHVKDEEPVEKIYGEFVYE